MRNLETICTCSSSSVDAIAIVIAVVGFVYGVSW